MRIDVMLIVLCLASPVFAHSGRLDGKGGHHDRKNGGYHYHRSKPIKDNNKSNAPSVTEKEKTTTKKKPLRGKSLK